MRTDILPNATISQRLAHARLQAKYIDCFKEVLKIDLCDTDQVIQLEEECGDPEVGNPLCIIVIMHFEQMKQAVMNDGNFDYQAEVNKLSGFVKNK